MVQTKINQKPVNWSLKFKVYLVGAKTRIRTVPIVKFL